jgi:16S rRNA (uracil1498-N3)-methyltransferase
LSRVRRFRVDSLEGLQPGQQIALPADEAAHARVLRLENGDALELFDAAGRSADAKFAANAHAEIVELRGAAAPTATRLILATAWPKGKRAALLVEKCSELGVHAIQPVAYARSVVSKDDESEGVVRLRRIAAEAAKQSGRNDVPEILAEQTFAQVLNAHASTSVCVLLDPRGKEELLSVLQEKRSGLQSKSLLLLVGPEGGFSDEELAVADARGIHRAKLARHVLRVETAALAACAICGHMLHLG